MMTCRVISILYPFVTFDGWGCFHLPRIRTLPVTKPVTKSPLVGHSSSEESGTVLSRSPRWELGFLAKSWVLLLPFLTEGGIPISLTQRQRVNSSLQKKMVFFFGGGCPTEGLWSWEVRSWLISLIGRVIVRDFLSSSWPALNVGFPHDGLEDSEDGRYWIP